VTESVWDYPRPPRLEPTPRRIRVVLGGETIADTVRAHRVLETSHPPVYYVPLEDVAEGALAPSSGSTFCEWKGVASYYDVLAAGRRVERGAWTYREPVRGFEAIRDAVAFYPAPMDACYVDDERAEHQPGGFYGGWVTSDLVGPSRARPARPAGSAQPARERKSDARPTPSVGMPLDAMSVIGCGISRAPSAGTSSCESPAPMTMPAVNGRNAGPASSAEKPGDASEVEGVEGEGGEGSTR